MIVGRNWLQLWSHQIPCTDGEAGVQIKKKNLPESFVFEELKRLAENSPS